MVPTQYHSWTKQITHQSKLLHLFYNNAEGWVNMTTPITLNKYGSGLSNKIDVVSDSYYNQGFTNFSLSIES